MNDTMKVLAIVDKRKTEILDVPIPKPGSDQILISIKACAICTWEQRVFTGVIPAKLPFVGGHEIAGVISELGENIDSTEFPIGTKVAARTLTNCGKCDACRSGADNICLEIRQPRNIKKSSFNGPGGMSQYLCVDARQVYKMPDETPFERIVFTEPLGCVLGSLEKAQIQKGDDVVVIGGGIMGLLHVICAKLSGARVILSEPDQARCAKAIELGVDYTIDPLKDDPVNYVKNITNGKGAEVVINTASAKVAVKQGIDMTAKQGRFIMFGLVIPNEPVEIDFNKLHDSETIITGSLSPSIRSFYRAANMLSKAIIKPEEIGLLSGTFDYKDSIEAFEASLKLDTYRVMLKF